MLRLSSLRRLLPSGVRWCARQLSALPFARLPFNSASVDLEQIQHELDDVALFSTRLWETIYKLRGDGVDAVYLRVPMLYAHLIPSAGLFGFRYHHAEGECEPCHIQFTEIINHLTVLLCSGEIAMLMVLFCMYVCSTCKPTNIRVSSGCRTPSAKYRSSPLTTAA
jgi:hypothetical protein